MTKTRLFTAALLGASALTVATPASAQRIDRIVSFGDSYADTGIATNIILSNPLTPPATATQIRTVYPTGRFSGGTNYIDTLSQLLNAPVVNYAVGGALTNTGNVNTGLPGFTNEVNAFLANGAAPFFPTNGGFQPGDLVAVSIGGNDARAYSSSTGASVAAAPTAAAASVTSATANLDRLVAAGAPTISFLAGDTGRLPEVATLPGVAAIRTAYSNAFNSGVQTSLARYAANGTMVHYLDLSKVLDNIAANPTAYGITNGTVCPIFPNSTCVISSAGYLFYGDALHLTSDGFKIVAAYVARQLTAPLTLQAPSDVGLDLSKQWGRTLTSRLDAGAPRDGGEATGVRFFAVGDTSSRRVGSTNRTDEYRVSMWGATAGVEFGFGNGVAGLAANYSKPRANFGNDASDDKARSVQVGGYAGYAVGGLFLQGYAGYGWDKHDITRAGVVEAMSASPKGKHYNAGIKGGYLMTLGGLRIGPVAALDYAKAKVDGYTETGDDALTLNVSSINVKSMRGSIGLEARGDLETGGLQFRPYGSAVIEKDFSGDGRTFLFSQTASPLIVNSWSVDDISKKAYGRFNSGFSAELGANVSLDVGGSFTVGKEQGNETSGQLGLRVGF